MSAHIVKFPFRIEGSEVSTNNLVSGDGAQIEDVILKIAVSFDQLSLLAKHSGVTAIGDRLTELIELTRDVGFVQQSDLLQGLHHAILNDDLVGASAVLGRLERKSEADCLKVLSKISVSGHEGSN